MRKSSHDFGLAFLALFTLSLIVFVQIPLSVFTVNATKLEADVSTTIPPFLLLALLATLLAGLPLLIWHSQRVLAALSGLCMGLGLLFWMQAHFLNKDYGQFDGSPIPWQQWESYGYLNAGLWIGAATLAAWLGVRLTRTTLLIALQGLLMFTIGTSILDAMNGHRHYQSQGKNLTFDPEIKFSFSSEKNVIFFLLDTMQSEVAQELLAEDKDLAEAFHDFTYFTNNVSHSRFTNYSLCSIFSGTPCNDNERDRNTRVHGAFLSPQSLIYRLRKAGFAVETYPLAPYPETMTRVPGAQTNLIARGTSLATKIKSVAKLLEAALFASLPQLGKRFIYDKGEGSLSTWATLATVDQWTTFGSEQDSSKVREKDIHTRLSKAYGLSQHAGDADTKDIVEMLETAAKDRRKPIFKLLHLIGGHAPHTLERDGSPHRLSGQALREVYKDTVYYKLKLIALAIRKLQEIGVYDQSLIILSGDHGIEYDKRIAGLISEKDEASLGGKGSNLRARTHTALFIKNFGEQSEKLSYSDKPLSLSDYKNIILGLALEGKRHIDEIATSQVRSAFLKWAGGEQTGALAGPELFAEFLITGHAADLSSWRPYHLHLYGEPSWKKRCVFHDKNIRVAPLGTHAPDTGFVVTAPEGLSIAIPIATGHKMALGIFSPARFENPGLLAVPALSIKVNGTSVGPMPTHNWYAFERSAYFEIDSAVEFTELNLELTLDLTPQEMAEYARQGFKIIFDSLDVYGIDPSEALGDTLHPTASSS